MPVEAPFQRVQREFAAYIRDPAGQPLPTGMAETRMRAYAELFFNNVRSLLAGTFPVLCRILGETRWTDLVRDYFRSHRAHTPLFPHMPREFLRYLQEERDPAPGDLPFMLELAHYEWVELALSIDPCEPDPQAYDPAGDLLQGRPRLSPLAWPLAYRFPVHRLGPDYQPEQAPPQPTYLLVYRDPRDAMGFLELNPVSARLLELLQQQPEACGAQLLTQIAAELHHPQPARVLQTGLELLQDLRARSVLLGVARD